jgi:23S rRNA pseudouridine2605 synthase
LAPGSRDRENGSLGQQPWGRRGAASPSFGKRGIVLTREQLQAARAAHWRQNQNPLLTLEDAAGWLEQHPLCLFLPRRAQLPAPAPSFVEACMGSAHSTPGAAAIEQAQALLTRLIGQGNAVALNLLGGVSEQPDFLVTSQALPYVLSLRGDADWKHAPQKSSGHKVSPLVLELWKALDKDGGLTALEARENLGRELTEAAVLRGLCELWQALRISPVFAEPGQPARWELLRVRHRDALGTASTTSQVTALSLLVSMYLQSVYAASSEEIEVFLSPVASRSRVREAVRGLSATRQIHSLSMDAQTYYFLEDGLPEFAEPAALPGTNVESPAPVANVAASRRPLPVQKPVERKDRVTRPSLPAVPPAVRAPRPAPMAGKGRPEPRPAPTTGWKSPRRPAAPGKPSWQQRDKPPAGGASPWRGKEGAPRPPLAAARSFSPGDKKRAGKFSDRPRRPVSAPGGTARPSERPGPGRDGQKRDRPAAWARPGQRPGPGSGQSRSGPRPSDAAGRGDSPFRPPQRPYDRPRPGGRPGGGPGRVVGRPPSRPPSRGQESPAAGGPKRAWGPAAGRPPGRPAASFRSKDSRGGPPRGARPSSGAAVPRPGPPRGGLGSDRKSNPGSRPDRGTSYGRPRPGGHARPANPGSSRGDQAPPRPPAAPGSRPAKPWSAKPSSRKPGGKFGGRPGKPPSSFRGSKPVRKKPGA